MGMTADAYRQQLFALLPRGAAWTARAAGTVLYRLLDGIAQELARADQRGGNLLDEVDPRTTVELLSDWERIAGLPDPCVGGIAQTLQQRRDALVGKLTGQGSQSKAYFIAVAAALGYTVTITEYTEFRAGISHAGDALTNGSWVFAWQVNAPLNTVVPFTAGNSQAGDPLGSWSNAQLECRLKQYAPAHTLPIFSYS